jgi:hypothetical protein
MQMDKVLMAMRALIENDFINKSAVASAMTPELERENSRKRIDQQLLGKFAFKPEEIINMVNSESFKKLEETMKELKKLAKE